MTTCKRMTGGCIKWLKQQNDSRVGTENRERPKGSTSKKDRHFLQKAAGHPEKKAMNRIIRNL